MRKLVAQIVIVLLCLAMAPLSAHEYWLDPLNYRLADTGQIQSHIRVGQYFKGDSYAYLPSEVESVQIHWQDTSRSIEPRFGATPAVKQQSPGEGLNILTISTSPFSLTYTEREKFEKFIKTERLDWVPEAHKKRGLPDVGFVEAYYRHAKTLVQVANNAGKDRKVGLKFEWVLQSNPYVDTTNELSAQLWWQNEQYANAHCKLFLKQGGEVTVIDLQTDDEGYVTLPRKSNANYLLNAVLMQLPSQQNIENLDAVWESHWASVTFSTEE